MVWLNHLFYFGWTLMWLRILVHINSLQAEAALMGRGEYDSGVVLLTFKQKLGTVVFWCFPDVAFCSFASHFFAQERKNSQNRLSGHKSIEVSVTIWGTAATWWRKTSLLLHLTVVRGSWRVFLTLQTQLAVGQSFDSLIICNLR